MISIVQRKKAVKLRKKGFSIRRIAMKLHVSVGSVENWCKGIVFTEKQKKLIEKNVRNPYYRGRGVYLRKLIRATENKINSLKNKGIKKIGKLKKSEIFVAGVALYWAEGFKKDSQVGLATLDPKMAQFFIKWLNICFDFEIKDLIFRITSNKSHEYRINEIENYWSKILNVPKDQFRKPFFQNVKWKKIYSNPENYFGVIRIKVRKSKDFLRLIHGFIEGLRINAT